MRARKVLFAQIFQDGFTIQCDRGIKLRCILNLLQVIQTAIFKNAVDGRNQTYWTIGIGIEMLVNGIWWNVDHITGFPLVALHFVLGFPVVSVRNFYVAVLVPLVTGKTITVERPRSNASYAPLEIGEIPKGE